MNDTLVEGYIATEKSETTKKDNLNDFNFLLLSWDFLQ